MTIDSTLVAAVLGGTILGGSLALWTAVTGRRAGVSGMAASLFSRVRGERAFAGAFLAGMVLAGAVVGRLVPSVVADLSGRPLVAFAIGGALVGWGARRANGCTSGHGIHGVSRVSARSLVAAGVFALVASLIVWVWPVKGVS